MFSYCSRGRVRSSDEWYINVPIPSPSGVSPRLQSPVTAMMRARWDEFVHRDPILLNASSPVNSCQFCHCRFQAVSWLCRGDIPEAMIFLRAALYWIIPYSAVPLWELELSSLPVALENTCLQCRVHSPARNRVAFLAIKSIFIMQFVNYSTGCPEWWLLPACPHYVFVLFFRPLSSKYEYNIVKLTNAVVFVYIEPWSVCQYFL